MTTEHQLETYMDGRTPIPYCKLCSAEGFALWEPCYPVKSTRPYFQVGTEVFTKEEFDEKYENCLDVTKQPAK